MKEKIENFFKRIDELYQTKIEKSFNRISFYFVLVIALVTKAIAFSNIAGRYAANWLLLTWDRYAVMLSMLTVAYMMNASFTRRFTNMNNGMTVINITPIVINAADSRLLFNRSFNLICTGWNR